MKEYLYQALPSPTHTRLLELQPAEDAFAELQCRIHHADIHDADAPLFDAISYTWGGEHFSRAIWIDDDTDELSQIPITANLFDALTRFRRHNVARYLWADAVCINQKDVTEKSTHIALMTDIYRTAATVLVWLGPFETGQHAISRINKLSRLIQVPSKKLSAPHTKELETTILELISLPWFSRRWIIQEVVLNPNITLHCKGEHLTFMKLNSIIGSLDSNELNTSEAVRALVTMYNLWLSLALRQRQDGKCTFSRLIEDFDHFGCADARDRLYTLAALAEDVTVRTSTESPTASIERSFPVIVDYENSVEAIYTRTARHLMGWNGTKWLFDQANARASADRLVNLPTWVPDWRILPQYHSLLCGYQYERSRKHTIDSSQDLQITLDRRKAEKIWSLGTTSAHVLRTNVCYVMNWEESIPEQYREGWNKFARLPQKIKRSSWQWGPQEPGGFMDFHWISSVKPAVDRNYMAPLSVTWKSEDFSRSTCHQNIKSWIKSTFLVLWGRVLASLDKVSGGQKDPNLEEQVWNACAERFAWVITAGGRFIRYLNEYQQDELRESCFSTALKDYPLQDDPRQWNLPSFLPGEKHLKPRLGERGDIDQMPSFGQMFEHDIHCRAYHDELGYLDWRKLNDMVRALLRSTKPDSDPDNSFAPLCSLVELTMRGRCLFTCDVDWKPLNALDGLSMGIGASTMMKGDRILSLSPGPLPEDDVNRHGGTKIPQALLPWRQTLIVREAYLDAAVDLERAYQNFVQEHGALEEEWPISRMRYESSPPTCSLRQPGLPPVYKVVGDCFTTATRWQTPSRGLQLRRWSLKSWGIGQPSSWQQYYNPDLCDLDMKNTDETLRDIILL